MEANTQQEEYPQIGRATQGVKRSLPLYTLFIANTISITGDRLMFIALPWLVLQTTGSASKAGITSFFETLAVVLSSFFSGLLLDRLGYKRSSVLADLASGIAVMLIPLCYQTIGLSFWQLQVLVFLAGLLQAPGSSARYAMLPDLIALAKMPPERANSLYDGVNRVSGFIGAPLAGILIVLIGTSNLLWVDGATFFISAILLAWNIPTGLTPQRKQAQSNYLQDMKEGLAFIWATPVIFMILITLTVTNLLDQGMSGVLMPDYGLRVLKSPVALGWLIASFGGAAFVGTMLFALIGHRLPRVLTIGFSFFLLSTLLRFFPLVLSFPFPILIASYALSGLMIGPINPILTTMEQEIVPTELRARVFGVTTSLAFLGMPVGGLIAGYLADWLGIIPTILIFGCVYVLSTGLLLVNPHIRKMDHLRKRIERIE
jgi:MFS family permease